jgi:lipopolysaccharide transport system ATP-binding protein
MGAFAFFVRSPFENYRNLRKLSRFDDVKAEDGRSKLEDGKSTISDLRSPSGASPSPISQLPSSIFHLPSTTSAPSDVFWALKNVSFEVEHGEVLGIIGRNGAGKSTLLKILSRITEPTSGRAEIFGRVASLLEVGTGFHPDLTGRENVYLNGTILGMRKNEVDQKFDEIVAFSEVEKFIDTPVKRYSSGMRVRLAFAVAANLEPEILIIDEVLAVGDLNFQRKCLGKMSEVAQHGRTVLFVSHNMAAVTQLCQRGIVLANGEVTFDGASGQSVDFYVRSNSASGDETETSNGTAKFDNLRVNGSIAPKIGVAEPFDVSVALRGAVDGKLMIALALENASGTRIFLDRWTTDDVSKGAPKRDHAIEVSVPNLFLAPGMYSVFFGASFISSGNPAKIFSEKLPLEIRGDSHSLGRTLLVPKIDWRLKTG